MKSRYTYEITVLCTCVHCSLTITISYFSWFVWPLRFTVELNVNI